MVINMPKLTKKEAGKLGGLATVKRHGYKHMAKIGKLGGEATSEKYKLVPYSQNKFAMVCRKTGEIIAIF
jgi:general stress protein YciG